jgi:hypothetical protein
VLRRARFVTLLVATSIVVAPLSAIAQTMMMPPPIPAPPPPAAHVGVRLESDRPSTEYRVFAGRREKAPWFQCMAPCQAEVPPGEYRFETTGPDMADGSVVAVIAASTRVSAEGGSKSAKSSGLVIGIVGSAITAVGLLGVVIESIPKCNYDFYGNCNEDPSHENDRHKGMIAFGIVAGVGALLATVGWVEFASNRTHMSTQTFAPPPPTTTVGIVPAKNGAVIGAAGFF